jgi:hypothetical protein
MGFKSFAKPYLTKGELGHGFGRTVSCCRPRFRGHRYCIQLGTNFRNISYL